MDRHDAPVVALLGLVGLTACGGAVEPGAGLEPAPELYASEVISFVSGAAAGYGEDLMPGVVLGAPRPSGEGGGSLDVLSLGVGGEIVLGFSGREIVDGPGPDFVVFENPFVIDGGDGAVFAELGEIAVSEDGQTWRAFECDSDQRSDWAGCAGWRPTLAYDPATTEALSPDLTGGDPFDLADLGLEAARFVRVRDLATEGQAPTGGFDLDAVGLVNFR